MPAAVCEAWVCRSGRHPMTKDEDYGFGVAGYLHIPHLTDVDQATHFFSIAPESAQVNQALPDSLGGTYAVDLHGLAGTTILYNEVSVHDSRQRVTGTERCTIHIYYGYRSQPRAEQSTIFPRRLSDWPHADFYGGLHRVSQEVHNLFE